MQYTAIYIIDLSHQLWTYCSSYTVLWFWYVHWFLLCTLCFCLNTLRPRQNGHQFPDDIFKYIFLYENMQISIKISLKSVPKGPINNIPALVQIMAWRQPGDKPLSEPMMVSLLTHICVTRPQWVNMYAWNIVVFLGIHKFHCFTAGTSKTSIQTLQVCPSQFNENLLISNSKLTSDSELLWWC